MAASFASLQSLPIATVTGLVLRIKKSYAPTTIGSGIAPTDVHVFMQISNSDVGNDLAVATDWPLNDYVTYGSSTDLTVWGITASTIKNNIKNGHLGFGIVAVNNNPDIDSVTAFVYEFEVTLYYTALSGAPMMAMMGVGM